MTADADRWRAVEQVLDAALTRPPEEWSAVLDARCGADTDLRREVEALLQRVNTARSYLDSPPVALAAAVVAEARSDAEAGATGRRIGAYRLEREIGRGGMSRVFLAERADGQFQQRVAVKLLRPGLDTEIDHERFRVERQILASLDHPHIARLLDGGVTPDEQPYLVLEHIDGQPIDTFCNERKLGVGPRIDLFLGVVSATEYAHRSLIVHRDLKPSNILVTSQGVVKLLDFGLAKLLEPGASPAAAPTTRTGHHWMTPEYAAPEQVLGQRITTQTDVYQLGAVLYQLLTGRLPFADAAGSRHALEDAVLRAEPPLPSSIRRELRGDLDAIVRRAMHKEPARRYPSASALGDDLRRVRSGHPVFARPDSAGYRVRKFVGRNRVAVAAAALAVTALLGATAFSLRQMQEAERQRDFALTQLSRAEAMSELNGFVLADAAPSGKPFSVGDLLARAAKLVDRDQAESDVNRVEMLVSLGRQHSSLGEEAEARRILQRAHDIAQRLPPGPTRGKAACALGSELGPAGDYAAGERLIREGLAQMPPDSRYASDRIFCLLRGSYLAREGGRGPLGVARADSARRLLDAAPLASPTLRLRILMDLAESYREVSAMPRADTMFQAAYAQLARLGREHTQTAGTLLNNWALVVRVLGQPRRSEQLFREAIRISSADSAESGVSPMLLNNYGGALYALGQMPEALRYARRAYALAEATEHAIVMHQALLLQVETYRELGDWAAAERKLATVEPKLRRALPPGHFVFAVLAQHHALLAAARGQLDSAATLADQAVAMAQKAGAPDDLLVLLYRRRSDIALRQERSADAVRDAERALELTRTHQYKDQASSILGAIHLGLGRALMHNGEPQRARTELDSASAHLLATLGPDHPQMREVTALRDSLRAGAP